MIQIVNSPNGTLLYKTAHVFSTVVDSSVVPFPTLSVSTGTLFTPIYTDKGPTGVVKFFSGSSALADLINTYGYPNVRKLGLSYTMAYDHVANGGNVAVISVKHDSATNAGFIVNLVIETKNTDSTNITKTLGWIKPDGSAFIEDAYASNDRTKPSVDHAPHIINSKRISFEVIELKDINSTDELELTVQTMYNVESAKTSPGYKRSFPFIWGLYKGKGQYGNNYQMVFDSMNSTISGRPYFQAQVYDKREASFVPTTKQVVSLSSDRLDSSPLFIGRRFSEPYSSGDFYVNTLDNNEFNFIGKLISDELDSTVLFPNSATVAGPEALALEDRKKSLLADFELPTDDDYHRLSKLDPSNMENLRSFFDALNLPTANFTGGSEGVLEDVGRTGFNWDALYNVAPTGSPKENERVLQEIFVKAFIGDYDSNVFNLLANPCDYIVDIGYPTLVKQAMVSFTSNRQDCQCIFNSPLSTNSISEAIAFKQSFNISGRNYYYYTGAFKYVDNRTYKDTLVPVSFVVLNNILFHYQNGFDQSIAGMTYGAVTGIDNRSGRGYGSSSNQDNDRLVKAGYNVISSHTDGVLYFDSQIANYLLTESSKLQEFHNNSITNRILKKMYLSLQLEKHKLNSAESVAKIIFKIQNDLNSEFSNKVRAISYEGLFESAYAQSLGLMQHKISIQFYDSIKYHHIYIDALGAS